MMREGKVWKYKKTKKISKKLQGKVREGKIPKNKKLKRDKKNNEKNGIRYENGKTIKTEENAGIKNWENEKMRKI